MAEKPKEQLIRGEAEVVEEDGNKIDEPFYVNKDTCEMCLMQCRAEERQAIERELGYSIEEAKRRLELPQGRIVSKSERPEFGDQGG